MKQTDLDQGGALGNRENKQCLPFTIRYGIVYSIMTPQKLEKLRGELAAMRQRTPKAREFEALAEKLGRRRVNRGKHPTWLNEDFPELRPLSIPDHKGRDLPKGTRDSILDQLEDDFLAHEGLMERDSDG